MTGSPKEDHLSRFTFSSALPWILVGARRGSSDNRDDAVLASGGDAGTELVGFVRQQEFSGPAEVPGRLLAPISRSARFGAVTSEGVPPSSVARDQRHSTYTFAWEGQAEPSLHIDEQFHRSLPDILKALDADSREDFEWAIARLVFAVYESTMVVRRHRRRLVWAIVIEFSVALLVVLVLLLLLR
jgi:hypothetical protein